MKFLINDKLTKEVSGIFDTKEDAEYYYLKVNVVEKLKYYCNKLLNNSELMENIQLIRKYEDLIEEINNYEKNDNFGHKFSYFLTVADEILYRYNKDKHTYTSVLNYNLWRFDDDKISIFQYNN